MNFVHLHVHTHFSLLDGLGKIDEIIAKAKEFNMPAIAITDHGTMYGVIEFYKKCLEAGIKPIIGVETYIAPRTLNDKVAKIDANPYHLVLLAKNHEGYQNLLKLVSIAHLKGYYYKPRIDKHILKKYSAGLIGMSACMQGEIPRLLLNGEYQKAKKTAQDYQKIFDPDSFYLEIQGHLEEPEQVKVNNQMVKISKETNIPLVATSDVHYVNKDDQEAHEVLLCVQTQKTINDKDRMSLADFDLSIKSPQEMKEIFADAPEAIENTLKITEMCKFEIKMGEYILPKFKTPKNQSAFDYLNQLAKNGLKEKYGSKPACPAYRTGRRQAGPPKQVLERLNYEMEVIEKTGFASYLLMVADYANFATDNGILINTRGSAAGSIVLYLVGITNVDPIEYGLVFERFLNPERISMTDVDLDIADRRRGEIIKYISQKYGKDHVAQIVTFGTMAAKASIRDCARAMGLQYSFADRLAKMIPLGMGLVESLEKVSELKAEYTADPQTRKLLDLAKKLEGVARHASVHAAGIVIGDRPLENYTPLQFSTRDPENITTQYEMHALEDIGLVKMDLLGLANLTIIEDAFKIISKTKEVDINIDKIPLNDKKTYDLLKKAETSGVFQLESEGMKRYLKELKPDNIFDIMAMVALYRPGPMEFIPDYIAGKHGLKKIKYLHPKLKSILGETYGVAVYQEQVLQIAREICGFTLGEADVLRKAIGKKIKELLLEQKKKWVEGAVNQNIKKELAERLFTFVEPFARYGFNKAHSATYGKIAYITAYLKANYPSEFMAAWLSSEQTRNIDKVAFALSESERMKLTVLPPNVDSSFVDFGVVKYDHASLNQKAGNIIYALAAIKNVGRGVAEKIVAERKRGGLYQSLEDFASRLGPEVINKKAIEALAKCGALDQFADRAAVVAGVEEITKFAQQKQKEFGSNQIGLFGNLSEPMVEEKINLPDIDHIDKRTKLVWEKEFIGIYLTEHPLGEYKEIIKRNSTPISEINESLDGKKVRAGGLITRVQKITTKNGEQMAFANLSDGSEIIELVVFPKIYAETSEFWKADSVLMITGKVNIKDGSPKVLVDKVAEIGEQMELDSEAIEKSEILNPKSETNSKSKILNSPASRFARVGTPASPKANAGKTQKIKSSSEKYLKIKVPKKSTKEVLIKIKEVLSMFSGAYGVVLVLETNGKKEIKLTDKVNICPALIDQLSEVIEKDKVIVVE